MEFIKNIHFTLLIRVNSRLHEFNFRKRAASLYDVDVSDDRGNRHFFKLVNDNANWKIEAGEIPAWIRNGEELIAKAIREKEENKV